MKPLLNAAVMVLALNFLAVVGVGGWLWQSGHLDKERVAAIKALLFPPPPPPPPSEDAAATRPATQPGEGALAMSRLDELLASQRGVKSAAEQVDLVQKTFDARLAQLDERQRQVEDLIQVAGVAQARVERERAAFEADRQQSEAKRQEDQKATADKGFQDTLDLYNALPGKQVKALFAKLDDASMARYLQAMEPRSASNVIKEFKAPDEVQRIHQVLERIRAEAPTTQESKE